ncbi:MAG: DUF1559 domain-containing protein [Planctomycetaceae bacterium]|nr:DUF1559 domain-containing protein [Planctomycetaceae bacterium]MCA9032394.1 DUF1559 domain-containing protein [Planctomycetaceae bacterium]
MTLLELLVTLSVIGLLMALLLSAVQSARASARRVKCASQLRQIGIATHNYVETYGELPNVHAGGLLFGILPFTEESARYKQATETLQQSSAPVDTVLGRIPLYQCPDDPLVSNYEGLASYVVNRGSVPPTDDRRAFVNFGGGVRWSDVTDGLSVTALASETRTSGFDRMSPASYEGPRSMGVWLTWTAPPCEQSMEWMGTRCLNDSSNRPADWGSWGALIYGPGSGYNHALPPNSGSCVSGTNPCFVDAVSATSGHSGGVQVLLADGSLRFVSESVDATVWRNVGSISDGNALGEW